MPRFLKIILVLLFLFLKFAIFYLFSQANLPLLPMNAWWVILLWQWFSFSFLRTWCRKSRSPAPVTLSDVVKYSQPLTQLCSSRATRPPQKPSLKPVCWEGNAAFVTWQVLVHFCVSF